MITSFGFYGSSNNIIASEHEELVVSILENIFSEYSNVRILTGGYGGFMESVCRKAKEFQEQRPDIYVETYGILYSGFSNKPGLPENPNSEEPNKHLDRIISANSLGERVDIVIEMSDFVFALPGSNGTHHEILHTIETIKYPPFNQPKITYDNFYVSQFWAKKIINDELRLFSTKDKLRFSNTIKPLDVGYHQDDIIPQLENLISYEKTKYRSLLCFDFAYILSNSKYELNEGINQSDSVTEYKPILDRFLEENGSLLSYGKEFKGYSKIPNSRQTNTNEKLHRTETPISRSTFEEFQNFSEDEVFTLWNNHLESSKFGQCSFWVNKVLKIKEFEVNISCFLILDLDLPKSKQELILEALDNHISTKGISLILAKIDSFLIERSELEHFRKNVLANEHTIVDIFGRTHGNIIGNEHVSSTTKNNFELLKICLDVTFNRSNQYLDKNLKGKGLMSFVRLLMDIQGYQNFTQEIIEEGNKNGTIVVNSSPEKLFILLWNFWRNAFKYSVNSNRHVDITIGYQDDHNSITFSNEINYFQNLSSKKLNTLKNSIKYLRGETEEIGKDGGLVISRDLIRQLHYCELDMTNTKIDVELKTYNIGLKIFKND